MRQPHLKQPTPPLHPPPLRRLDRIWIDDPIFFITTNVSNREPLLACDDAHAVILEVFETGQHLHRWLIGSYVVMPDHVHFFCSACRDAAPLDTFVGKWKEWTSKFFKRRLGWETFAWQHRFHDHLLRSDESYSEKWEYVRMNPVRAGLVNDPDEWRFRGRLNVF